MWSLLFTFSIKFVFFTHPKRDEIDDELIARVQIFGISKFVIFLSYLEQFIDSFGGFPSRNRNLLDCENENNPLEWNKAKIII